MPEFTPNMHAAIKKIVDTLPHLYMKRNDQGSFVEIPIELIEELKDVLAEVDPTYPPSFSLSKKNDQKEVEPIEEICPLLSAGDWAFCQRDKCAWWISEYETCAIKDIAASLYDLRTNKKTGNQCR